MRTPDTGTGRWDFMEPFIRVLTSHCVAVHETHGSLAALILFWPTLRRSSSPLSHELHISRLRDAMVLVSYMLRVDEDTHRFFLDGPTRRISSYTESTKALPSPRMTIILSEKSFGQNAENPLEQVRRFLSGRSGQTEDPGDDEFIVAERRLRDREDLNAALSGFSIPIVVMLRPPRMNNSSQLDAFFVGILELAKATKSIAHSNRFSLVNIALDLPSDRQFETDGNIRELFSLGVPIKVLLSGAQPESTLCHTPTNRFAMLADDPVLNQPSSEARVTVVCHNDEATAALWSAVAYSHCLRQLKINRRSTLHPLDLGWIAFALGRSPSLTALSIDGFQPTDDQLCGMERIVSSPQPEQDIFRGCGLVSFFHEPLYGFAPLRLVATLERDAVLCTTHGELKPMAGAGISPQWRLPVVRIDQQSQDGKIYVIAPGLGVCSTSIARVTELEAPRSQTARLSSLSELSLSCDKACAASVARLLMMFGRELLDFSIRVTNSLDGESAVSLDHLLDTCPKLERLEIDGGYLQCMFPMVGKAFHLQELSLGHTRVSTRAMIEFWRIVGDNSTKLARTLEVFTHLAFMEEPVALHAICALESNARLCRVTLRMNETVLPLYRMKLKTARQVVVPRQMLTLRQKAAFLSATLSSQKANSACAQLDESCISRILAYSRYKRYRRVVVL